MKISIQNFTQLNEYLEKAEGKLLIKPEKDAVILQKIQQVIRENLGVVTGSDVNEVGRFLQSVKQITAFGEGEGLVKMAIDAVANASGSVDLNTILKFKELDETLYYESLAHHISSKKLPIKSLGLSEEEMIKVMPWVTHLDLTDAARVDLPFVNIYEFVDYAFTDQFIEKLLENAVSLESLEVRNSNISGSAFSNKNLNGLLNLKKLRIDNCHAFNHSLNGLQNLRDLIISDCELFNQSINEIPSLKFLGIYGCPSFNESINRLQSLDYLSIMECGVFNQELNGLQNLRQLSISGCQAFNLSLNGLQNLREFIIDKCQAFSQSLNGLQNLMKLTIEDCNAYNQSQNGLQNLRELKILGCNSFNESLSGLQNLKDLRLEDCDAFNQSLNGLQNLTKLRIKNCSAFEIKDIHTAYIINKLRPKMIKKLLPQKSPRDYRQFIEGLMQILEEKAKTLENITPEIGGYLYFLPYLKAPRNKLIEFHKRIPLLDSLLVLYSLNEAIKRKNEPESVKAEFTALREKPNYLDFLQITVRAFPELTSFLIRDLKEEIVLHLKSLCISDQLSLESRMALLPIFPAEQIWQLVSAVPKETKARWLEMEIQFEQFSGRVEDVLAQIAESNIQHTDQAARDNLLVPLKELIAKIPFKVLSVLASVSPEIILAYTFAMEDAQMASVIPLLPDEALFQHLMNQPMPTHLEFLLYASIRQKEAYIADDLMKEPESLTEWHQGYSQIEELITKFENEMTKERFEALETAWREIVNKTNIELQVYAQVGKSLQNKLLKFSPDKEYENKVISYLEPKMKRAGEILQSLKTNGEKIKTLEKQVVGQVEIPGEFVDSITGDLMKSPHHHPSTPEYIYDLSTWQMMSTHPATRAPVNLEELVPDAELKAKIEAFQQNLGH